MSETTTPSNGNPGWVQGYAPTAAEWAAAFTNKVDAANGVLSGATVAGSLNIYSDFGNPPSRRYWSYDTGSAALYYSKQVVTGGQAAVTNLYAVSDAGQVFMGAAQVGFGQTNTLGFGGAPSGAYPSMGAYGEATVGFTFTVGGTGSWQINNGQGALLFQIIQSQGAANGVYFLTGGPGAPAQIGQTGQSAAGLTLDANGGVLTLGHTSGDRVVLASGVPASSAANGTPGQIAVDANYVYVCTAANTWKRAALASW